MRILHLTRDHPPRSCGGISSAVAGLVRALAADGIRSAVASYDAHPSPPGPGDVLRFTDARDMDTLVEFARAFAPERIQLHVDLLWDVAAELRERLAVPIVATIHVCHRHMLRVLGAERKSASLVAQERALDLADLLVSPTRAAADTILADYPQVGGRLRVARFTVDPAPPASLDARRVVSVGRFGAVKGTDRLIAALPHLLSDPELEIDVVGGLPRSPQRERRWASRFLDAAGEARERVRLHGWLSSRGCAEIVGGGRVLLSASRAETFGLAVLEALARGVPVCGFAEPALVETAPGQAWLPPDADPRDFAAAAVALASDVDRCRDLGRAGRAGVRPWSSVVGEWREAFAASG